MSLINDALRKARKEAAERDAEERGSTYRPPRAHLPSPRSSWVPGLVVGLVVGLGVAFLAYLALRAPVAGPTDPAEVIADEPSSSPTETAPVAEPVAEPEPQPEPEPASVPTPSTAPPVADPTPETAPTHDDEPPDDEPPEDETLPSDAPRLVQPPEQIGPVGAPADRVFVLEAEVDGTRLELDFIVWSAAEPFAQVNGNQVTVGQAVDGFIVRAVEREQVVLEGDGGLVTLRVR